MSEPPWACRGVRGAVLVESDTVDAIHEATRALMEEIISANGIEQEDVASVIFTVTPDLNAAYPATAARRLGWYDTALLSTVEMAPPDSPPRCIRVLIHWNTRYSQKDIHHVYIRGAEILRPDRAQPEMAGDHRSQS